MNFCPVKVDVLPRLFSVKLMKIYRSIVAKFYALLFSQ